MGIHRPNVIYPCHRVGIYPNISIETVDEGHVKVLFYLSKEIGHGFVVKRRLARLLAKRLNQALDDTLVR